MSPNNDETHSHSNSHSHLHLHSRSLWSVRTCARACVCKMNNHVQCDFDKECEWLWHSLQKAYFLTERPFSPSHAYHLIQNDTLFLSKSTRLLTKKTGLKSFRSLQYLFIIFDWKSISGFIQLRWVKCSLNFWQVFDLSCGFFLNSQGAQTRRHTRTHIQPRKLHRKWHRHWMRM